MTAGLCGLQKPRLTRGLAELEGQNPATAIGQFH